MIFLDELYVLAYFNKDGTFGSFVRKGRNNAISAYDNLASAKRGLTQTRSGWSESIMPLYKIVKAGTLEVVDEG